MFPKLVALDTDWTIWAGSLDEKVWGKGPGASQNKIANNIEQVNDSVLKDRSNDALGIRLNQDIPSIVHDVLKNGASLAIVSRNTSKALSDRALYYFKTVNPSTGAEESIINLVKYDEVVDEPKTEHFKRIHGWSKFPYEDMISFDDEPEGNVKELRVMVVGCPKPAGLTWEIYSRGIEFWRSKRAI
ncbi:hypothetical protein AX16_003823 [Volvariella volvacea WC 439]|nr:hypothetical protein AX16_003823 [Volvariella volvacea WC 439]